MRIQHNIMAMNAYRNYNNNTSALSKNLEKLSSGYKINRAGDDAAGLAISEKMRAQITGLNAAQKNVKDGISLVKTGEGAMQEIQDMLNRMDYLATQSANGTYDNEVDRLNLQKEVNALKTEINRIADSANFNGIKLLDGSLDRNVLATEAGVTTNSVDFAKGIDFEIGQGGGGSKGEFSLTIDNLFGAGDTLTIAGAKTDGTAINETVNFGTGGITGKTAEEQAKSLADALSKNANLTDFDVTVDGATVTLKNKVEGSGQAIINPNGFTVTNKVTTVDATNTKASTPGADNAAKGSVKFDKIFDGQTGTGLDLSAGDKVTFEFTMGSGTKYTAELEITDAMIGTDNATTAANIAREMASVKFSPNGDTAAAEEQLKVGDLFTITADATAGLTFEAKPGTGGGDIASATIATSRHPATVAATATVNAPTAEVYDLAMTSTGTGATNFTAGDKITLKGQLSDGRTYELELTAGKDFELGADYQASFGNLKTELEVKGKDITVKDANGKEEVVDSTDIFGTGKEFTLTAAADKLTVTSLHGGVAGGKGVSSTTSIEVTPADATSVTQSQVNGTQQTGAKSTISFSEGVQYGATIDIDGQTYEIVKTGERTTSAKNVAVEVDDLSDTSAIAKSLADSVNKQLGGDPITATASGSKVTLTTKEIGSTAVSPTVATAGDKVKQLEFTLDPNRVQEKSYVTINGQDYQFVSDKSKVDEGKTAVVVDFKNATSASLAAALKDVADGKNNTTVSVDADGLVKVRGTENEDGEIVTPTASFHDGKGGLNLQIGDTAEDFNQMNVSIGDMHTSALGIDGVNIGNQEDARAAIDVIKDAINYVSGVRGDLGAIQNRLDHTANNLSVMAENIQDAESTIRDTDVAEEMMSYVKNNILVQSAQAMLAQANQVPQGVLQLLG